jgi:hypothetical protein
MIEVLVDRDKVDFDFFAVRDYTMPRIHCAERTGTSDRKDLPKKRKKEPNLAMHELTLSRTGDLLH